MKRHRNKDRRQLRKYSIFYKAKKFLGGFALIFLIAASTISLFAQESIEGENSEPEFIATQEPEPKVINEELEEVGDKLKPKEEPELETPIERLHGDIEEDATEWVEIPIEIIEDSEEREETNSINGIPDENTKGTAKAVKKTSRNAVKATTLYVAGEDKEPE